MAAGRARLTILSESPAAPSGVPPTTLTLHQKLLAVGLVLAVMLVAFEVTAVITALPTITDELGGDSLYGVSLAAYTLATLVSLVAAGELADRYGPTVPFTVNIVLFVVGLVVGATANSMVLIVIGRTLQGAGTGGFPPIAYVLVKRAFPDDRQAAMYAFLSAGWVLPSLFAPAISGWITESFGWRWLFWAIIPLAVAVGVLAVRPMRDYGPVESSGPAAPSRVPTAVAAAVGIGALVIGLQVEKVAVAIVTSLIGTVVMVVALRRLLPAGFGRARSGLPALIAVRMSATAAFLGVDSFVPLAADRIHEVSPLKQGFVIIGAALTWTVGQWYRVRRPGRNPVSAIRIGFLVMLLGILLVTPVLSASWPLPVTFAAWAVGGLGMGLLFNPSTIAAMSYATEGNEGLVSSQVNLADSVGFSLMGGIGGATVAIAERTSWPLRDALGLNFALAAAMTLVGVAVCRNVRSAAA